MKTIKNLIIAITTALLVTVSMGAFANTNPANPVIVEKTASKKVKLKVEEATLIALSITDAAGIKIYQETTTEEATKLFNLNQLESGNYTLTVELTDRIIEQEVIVTAETVELKEAVVLAKPVFTVGKNNVQVEITGLSAANVRVFITDDASNEVYQDESKAAYNFGKNYVLRELPAGTYYATVIVNDRSYTQSVTIK